MARFRNPPIVEAWIAFDFEPRQDKVAWDLNRAQEFTHQHHDRFPKVEVVVRQDLKIEETKGSLPRVVSRAQTPEVIRMWGGVESSRVLQIADDKLAYNILERGVSYPGFGTLLSEATEFLELYQRFFETSGVRGATLHYTDIITIPAPGPVEATDYFTIIQDLPARPFGCVTRFATSISTQSPLDNQLLQMSLAMIPPAEPKTLRFQMEWDKHCGGFTSFDATFRESLLASHEFMVDCFEKSITPKTRSLFEPNC